MCVLWDVVMMCIHDLEASVMHMAAIYVVGFI